MKEERGRSRWIAIITGAISVAIGVLYLGTVSYTHLTLPTSRGV